MNSIGLARGATRIIRLPAPSTGCDLSNDGTRVAVSLWAPLGVPSLCVYDTATGDLVHSVGADKEFSRGDVVFGRGGECLYALVETGGGIGLELRRFDGDGDDHGTAVAVFTSAYELTRNRSADLLAVLGEEATVMHDDAGASAPEVVRVIPGIGPRPSVHARFPAAGPYLYCLGVAEGHLVRWDIAGNREAGRWPTPSGHGAVTISASGRYAFTAKGYRGSFAFDTHTGERFKPELYNEDGADPVAFSPDETGFVYPAGAHVGFRDWATGRTTRGERMHHDRILEIHGAWEADVYTVRYGGPYLCLAARP